MDSLIDEKGNVVYYVVRVNGQDMSPKLNSKMLAEMEIPKLAPELQSMAEIVPVTADGRQVLLD